MRLSFASRIFLYPLATTGAELDLFLMNGGRPRESARERERGGGEGGRTQAELRSAVPHSCTQSTTCSSSNQLSSLVSSSC
ncbi:hypothetical protein AMECASPLE_025122 [Ameca splendens]|uniref:Secreted protein n=1 Tax=Ameca splendens TaxID=208324 RepID=A0ABV0XTH1_9TELE